MPSWLRSCASFFSQLINADCVCTRIPNSPAIHDVFLSLPSLTEARIIADTGATGFAYGDRLIYDWVFVRNSQDDTTEVSLNLFLKVNSVLYLPIWDAMQQVLTEKMLQAFEARAKEIKGAK